MMSADRVVITGLGPVTPIGSGKEIFWNALLAGTEGAAEVRKFDTSMYKVHRGCEVKGFERPDLKGDPGPASYLAVAGAKLALEDAGLSDPPRDTGVVIGTTGGEIPVLEKMNRTRVSEGDDAIGADEFLKYPCHVISGNVAHFFDLRGPNQVVPTACSAGNYALSIGRDWIRKGKAQVVLAGGADPLSVVSFTGFGRIFAISPDHCRPFDKNRQGILPGEGAGMLLLESLESARARGAHIYAEVRGAGLSCDAYHPTMPHPDGLGAQLAMQRALADGQLNPEQVDYVSAHGTGTQANDKVESGAICTVLGDRVQKVPVSSIKSMLGHTMGAASAIEAIACALSIDRQAVPPTINYSEPDPACSLDVVPNEAREVPVQVALSNAYAFGGNNCCVAFAKVES